MFTICFARCYWVKHVGCFWVFLVMLEDFGRKSQEE
jgi:hypothetical protein